MRKLECLGGPLCGSKVEDTYELWFGIQSVDDDAERHFYKRVKIIDMLTNKSCLVWHYHGNDPNKEGVPLIRPSSKRFR